MNQVFESKILYQLSVKAGTSKVSAFGAAARVGFADAPQTRRHYSAVAYFKDDMRRP